MRNRQSYMPIFILVGLIIVGFLWLISGSQGAEKSGFLQGLEKASGIH